MRNLRRRDLILVRGCRREMIIGRRRRWRREKKR